MNGNYSVRFADDCLNRRLIALLEESHVAHTVAEDGTIHYSASDEQVVGNELIQGIRRGEFASWQILCCPSDWVERYKTYMVERQIPFQEEIMDGEVQFLISRRYRPHSWQLENGNALALSDASKREAPE